MLKKINIKIENVNSINDKALIETEIDVLNGVKDVYVNERSGESSIEFDDGKVSQDKPLEAIKKLGFKLAEAVEESPSIIEHTYFVKGMHCASCEILIEKKILSLEGVKSVEASTDKGKVLIVYQEQRPATNKLNEIFKKENYIFYDHPVKMAQEKEQKSEGNDFPIILGASLLIVIIFFVLKNAGFTNLVNVSSTSSLPTFFLLGLMAGISTCAALIGGLVLSMSKQWLEVYSENDSVIQKLQPHLMFNAGRIVSFSIFGGILGILGNKLEISLTFTSFLIIAVSIMMVFLALQMLGVKAFRRFQLTMPKMVTRYVADETNFQGKYMPFSMGALTFFLPCGFSITAQGMALISGSPIQGALIMLFFALGTAPVLLIIGLSAIKFSQKSRLFSLRFSKIAGVLVLFFALYNVNAQLNILGVSSLSDIKVDINTQQASGGTETGLPPIVDGKQVLKMDAFSSGYQPNYLKVKAGIPVRWEVTDKGTSGCTNAIISTGLFSGSIDLVRGQTSIKEFTPTKAGKYKFSCWMGMISGIIEVVDGTSSLKPSTANTQVANSNNDNVIPSGAKGCGGSGGGSTSGGGGCGSGGCGGSGAR